MAKQIHEGAKNKKQAALEVLARGLFAESGKLLRPRISRETKADSDEAPPARVRTASRLDSAASERLLDLGSSRLAAGDALLLA